MAHTITIEIFETITCGHLTILRFFNSFLKVEINLACSTTLGTKYQILGTNYQNYSSQKELVLDFFGR